MGNFSYSFESFSFDSLHVIGPKKLTNIVVNGRVRFANRFVIPFLADFTPSIRESIFHLKNRFFDSFASKSDSLGKI